MLLRVPVTKRGSTPFEPSGSRPHPHCRAPQVCVLPAEGVARAEMSPAGRFVVTLQKANKESGEKNLKVRNRWVIQESRPCLPATCMAPAVERPRHVSRAM